MYRQFVVATGTPFQNNREVREFFGLCMDFTKTNLNNMGFISKRQQNLLRASIVFLKKQSDE